MKKSILWCTVRKTSNLFICKNTLRKYRGIG